MEFTIERLSRAAQIAPVLRMLLLNDGKTTVKLLRCEKSLTAGMNIPRPSSEYENVLGKNTLVLKENITDDEMIALYNTFKNENGITLQPLNMDRDEYGKLIYEPLSFTNEQIEKLPVRILGVFEELRRKKRKN